MSPDEGRTTIGAGRRRVATGAVLLGLVVAAFEGTVVAGAMPSITRALGGMQLYAWAFTAFLVTSTLGVLVCGKLADVYGRRPVFVAGMGVFLVGSVLCGLAPTAATLIAFRALQGLGAGAIQPIAMTITGDLYTMEERARIQSVFTTSWGGANVLGPLIGGWIVTHASWRWVFLVNVPVGLLAIALLMGSYRDPPRSEGVTREPAGVGAAIGAGGVIGLVLLALEPGRHAAPWWRAPVALAAVTALALFALHQSRADRPLLARDLARDRTVRAGLLGGLFSGALLYACSAYVPLWITQRTHSAMYAGAALVPLLLGWAVASTFSVRVLIQRGMRASVAGGFGVAVCGAIGLLVCTRSASPHAVGGAFVALAVLGMGIGPAASTSLIAAQSHVEWHQRAVITSTVYASRTLGGSLAVAALAAVHAVHDAQRAFLGIAVVAVLAFATAWSLSPTRRAVAGR